MQNYSSDLLDIYHNAPASQIFRAHLFMIGPCRNGAMIYATDGRKPIVYGGNTYHPWLYGFYKRGTITRKIGFDATSVDITVYSDEQFQPIYFPGTGNLVYLMDGINAGLLAAAPVTIYRATMLKWGTVVGPSAGSLVTTRFVGEVGPINDIGPTKCTIVARDLNYRLNLECPEQLIQANCRWVLYSPGCTLSAAAFTVTGTIGALVDPRTFTLAANLTTATPAGTFAKGVLKFTTGKNNGIAYAVAAWIPGGTGADTIQLDAPPLFGMTPGDTFSVQQGCDHTFTSCLDFQNTNAVLNFGGAPFTPVPETAV
jgi:hypothetical protein